MASIVHFGFQFARAQITKELSKEVTKFCFGGIEYICMYTIFNLLLKIRISPLPLKIIYIQSSIPKEVFDCEHNILAAWVREHYNALVEPSLRY